MHISYLKFLILSVTLALASASAFGQKGVTSTYKADAMHLMFFHVGSDEPVNEPILTGRNLIITHNLSYESLTVEYTDARENTRKKLFLDFLRYDKDADNAAIMKDRYGNVFTVYIYEENDSISIVAHELIDKKFVAVQSILSIKKVY